MVDREQLRQTIEAMPPKGRVACVTKPWLEEVARDLAELAQLREQKAAQA
jgi:hypothetical protein